MFHSISDAMLARMQQLAATDAKDRDDGTPGLQRLRQIPPEVGKFIAILAASSPAGNWLEIGASAGYSAMWLSLACRETGRKLRSYEILPEKVRLARQTFELAGINELVELIHGDALEHLGNCKDIAFCFLDAEKEVYERCYELIIPRMVKGGILVADNAINFEQILRPMINRALQDDRVDALVVPIGQGELVCRRR
jgi:caffeoyl-CoA O-methyltransferase